MNDGLRIGTGHDPTIPVLLAEMHALRDQGHELRVLELGTRRWESDPTHHREEWGHPSDCWVLSDLEPGTDVDVVADVHHLGRDLVRARVLGLFDFVIACSTLEHVARPWTAMREIASVMRPGAMVYLATHQTFPIHGYPSDYWRFTEEALDVLGEDAGLERVKSSYQYPCQILPGEGVDRWNEGAAAYLGVSWLGRAL